MPRPPPVDRDDGGQQRRRHREGIGRPADFAEPATDATCRVRRPDSEQHAHPAGPCLHGLRPARIVARVMAVGEVPDRLLGKMGKHAGDVGRAHRSASDSSKCCGLQAHGEHEQCEQTRVLPDRMRAYDTMADDEVKVIPGSCPDIARRHLTSW